MTLPNMWGAPQWALPAVIVSVITLLLVAWSYLRSSAPTWVRVTSAILKLTAIVLVALCLVEPMHREEIPEPGANLLAILADSSQSLQIHDEGADHTRAQLLKERLDSSQSWQKALEKHFDLRRFTFDQQLRAVPDYANYEATGSGSAMMAALKGARDRFAGRPQAGIILLSDGNATDFEGDDVAAADWDDVPPIYPVVIGQRSPARDISVTRVSVTESNFEAAPVTVAAEMVSHGYANKNVVVQLLDPTGKEVQRQTVTSVADDRPFAVRFQVRPQESGVVAYRVRAFAESEDSQWGENARLIEATIENNQRYALIDRLRGPYRVLYVTGRPNWEYKFLRRAMDDDPEVQLVAVVRIAKREPKFTFRAHLGERTNPLFRGFDVEDEEQAEQYDQPVLLRLGTEDDNELRDGFPKTAEELFRYHAVILDDLEVDFFTQDQRELLKEFVSVRGGGFLMLGGQESFVNGQYHRTPIGEMLPVYVDRANAAPLADGHSVKLQFTREGWLQAWVRGRPTEEEELKRIAALPEFKTINHVSAIKPGATVLMQAIDDTGTAYPALVTQRFGKGRTGAMLIGDQWRGHMRRTTDDSDLMRSWRQTLRWLVADVPRRVEVAMQPTKLNASQTENMVIKARDEAYAPLDNAETDVHVSLPDGSSVALQAEPSRSVAGLYETVFVSRDPGFYHASVTVLGVDGLPIDEREIGWVSEPATDEFRELTPNRAALQQLADKTGGKLLTLDELDDLATELPHTKVPLTKTLIRPWWHSWQLFGLAVAMLVTEWGLRRWKGLP
ncbi:MAG: glutamine amidotransferase [Pirellulaceae bacterium]|nr:hypothetical protein [Planctomycetales bacterium]